MSQIKDDDVPCSRKNGHSYRVDLSLLFDAEEKCADYIVGSGKMDEFN